MKVDALKDLWDRARSIADVEQIYDAIMDSDEASSAAQQLGLSREEWTAFANGVWFDELARWRYEGWPKHCTKCGAVITLPSYGWRAIQRDDHHVLIHLKCPRLRK